MWWRNITADGDITMPRNRSIWNRLKMIKYRSPGRNIIKDFIINYRPSLLSFRADVNPTKVQPGKRSIDSGVAQPFARSRKHTTSICFVFDRAYNMRWDLTRSSILDFLPLTMQRVTNPLVVLIPSEKKDSPRRNFFKGRNTLAVNKQPMLLIHYRWVRFSALDWTTARFNYAATYNWIGASVWPWTLVIPWRIPTNGFYRPAGFCSFYMQNQNRHWKQSLTGTSNRSWASPNIKFNPKDTVGKSKQYARLFRRPTGWEAKKDKACSMIKSDGKRAFAKSLLLIKRLPSTILESRLIHVFLVMPIVHVCRKQLGYRAPVWFCIWPPARYRLVPSCRQYGWMTLRDTNFNFLFTQSYRQGNWNWRQMIEPVRDLTIDLNPQLFSVKLIPACLKLSGSKFANLNPYAGSDSILRLFLFKPCSKVLATTGRVRSFSLNKTE